VTLFGNTIESASMEREEVGSGKRKRLEKKYTMKQLLDPDFRLPREDGPARDNPARTLKSLEGKGVKVFKVED
jgi:glutathione synthase/RimK-type ligase-like ATP-grasp enzyme